LSIRPGALSHAAAGVEFIAEGGGAVVRPTHGYDRPYGWLRLLAPAADPTTSMPPTNATAAAAPPPAAVAVPAPSAAMNHGPAAAAVPPPTVNGDYRVVDDALGWTGQRHNNRQRRGFGRHRR
jgi:hypothetical protein